MVFKIESFQLKETLFRYPVYWTYWQKYYKYILTLFCKSLNQYIYLIHEKPQKIPQLCNFCNVYKISR